MKHPTGYASSRRTASPERQVQLELRRSPGRNKEPKKEPETEQKSHFWRWVGLVALLHVVVISLFCLFYEFAPSTPPPEPFISLLPPGDTVKGTPGAQQAPKIGPSTPAPSVQHTAPPPVPVQPPPQPVAVKPPPVPVPQPVEPPVVKTDVPQLVPDKPVPKPPQKVKVKVDLTQLVDGPVPDKPVVKPKHHKKPVAVAPTDDNAPDSDAPSNPNSTGLSKEQIAQQLGKKIEESGATNAEKIGKSGSANSHANSFADFYDSIRDQAYSKWKYPNLADETANSPVVTIHVEKDGHVPPDQVVLTQSSGNAAYDQSALAAAKSLGYLYQPLPEGCPPDISINFKLTR